MHHSSTSTYIPNFIEIEETFCGWTIVRTDGPLRPALLGRLGGVDLKTKARFGRLVWCLAWKAPAPEPTWSRHKHGCSSLECIMRLYTEMVIPRHWPSCSISSLRFHFCSRTTFSRSRCRVNCFDEVSMSATWWVQASTSAGFKSDSTKSVLWYLYICETQPRWHRSGHQATIKKSTYLTYILTLEPAFLNLRSSLAYYCYIYTYI